MIQLTKVERAPSFSVDIFIAGDLAVITQVCREFCMKGMCVSVAAVDFVYTGGLESGARIGLINYPRFPTEPDAIVAGATDLAMLLMERCCQTSCSIVSPTETTWLSRRRDT